MCVCAACTWSEVNSAGVRTIMMSASKHGTHDVGTIGQLKYVGSNLWRKKQKRKQARQSGGRAFSNTLMKT